MEPMQVVNHGAAIEVLNMMKEAAVEFFELPLGEKNKFAMAANDIQGYGHTNVEIEDQKLDWSDTLVLAVYPERFRRLQFWPTTPPHFKYAQSLLFQTSICCSKARCIATTWARIPAKSLEMTFSIFPFQFAEKPWRHTPMKLRKLEISSSVPWQR